MRTRRRADAVRFTGLLGLLLCGGVVVADAGEGRGGEAFREAVARGDELRGRGLAVEAVAEYQRAMQLDDSDADLYGRLGHALLEAGNPERAMKIFERQIALAPKDCAARVGLGAAHVAQGLADQAVRTFEDALKLCPEDAATYFRLGDAYARASYPIEAIEALRRSIELDPKNIAGYERLGQLYFDRQLYPEAAGMYEAVLAAAAGVDEGRLALARSRLGAIFRWAGSCDRAVPHWEAALASPGADGATRAGALQGLADCRAEAGETGKAIELAQRLVAEQPKTAAYYYRLGDLLNEAGRAEDALEIAKQGKAVDGPCPAHAHCILGRAYEKLGGAENWRRAEREFQQAIACGDAHFTDYARSQSERMQALLKAEEAKR